MTLDSTGGGITLTGTHVSATPSSVTLKAEGGALQILQDAGGKGAVTGATSVSATSTGDDLTINDVPVTATGTALTLGSGGRMP